MSSPTKKIDTLRERPGPRPGRFYVFGRYNKVCRAILPFVVHCYYQPCGWLLRTEIFTMAAYATKLTVPLVELTSEQRNALFKLLEYTSQPVRREQYITERPYTLADLQHLFADAGILRERQLLAHIFHRLFEAPTVHLERYYRYEPHMVYYCLADLMPPGESVVYAQHLLHCSNHLLRMQLHRKGRAPRDLLRLLKTKITLPDGTSWPTIEVSREGMASILALLASGFPHR